MDHPNIAKVLCLRGGRQNHESGVRNQERQGSGDRCPESETAIRSQEAIPPDPCPLPPDSAPYVVTELVQGAPITRYCDDARLDLKERLELFIPVCQAVQHAHQKGIIHGALKPSNILVSLADGRPTPKVIDFAASALCAPSLNEWSGQREVAPMTGALEHLSPEQAGLNNLDVDARADAPFRRRVVRADRDDAVLSDERRPPVAETRTIRTLCRRIRARVEFGSLPRDGAADRRAEADEARGATRWHVSEGRWKDLAAPDGLHPP